MKHFSIKTTLVLIGLYFTLTIANLASRLTCVVSTEYQISEIHWQKKSVKHEFLY